MPRRAVAAALCSALTLAGAVAAAPPPRPAALDAVTDSLVDDLATELVEFMCAPVAGLPERIDVAVANRTDLPPEQAAEYRARLGESGPKLHDACVARTRAAAAAPDGPRATLSARLAPALATHLQARDLERTRSFLESGAGRRLAEVRRDFNAEAFGVVAPWVASFGPALYGDLRMMLTAEVGTLPPPASEPAPAPERVRRVHIRNASRLGAACSDFYPEHSRRAGEQGAVVMLLRISDGGRLAGLLVETSSGYPALDVAAAACVGAHAEFEPQLVGERPIAVWERLRWTWRLAEGDAPTGP